MVQAPKIRLALCFDDDHMDGGVWKDRLSSRLQNHNRFIVDGNQFKDGKKAKALTEGRSEELKVAHTLHPLGRCHIGKQKLQHP